MVTICMFILSCMCSALFTCLIMLFMTWELPLGNPMLARGFSLVIFLIIRQDVASWFLRETCPALDLCEGDEPCTGIDQDQEVAIPVGSGFLVFPKAPTPVDYIRLVRREGWLEIAYWTYTEWEESQEVMGAILGCLSEFCFGLENSLDKSGPCGILKADRTGKSDESSDTGA